MKQTIEIQLSQQVILTLTGTVEIEVAEGQTVYDAVWQRGLDAIAEEIEDRGGVFSTADVGGPWTDFVLFPGTPNAVGTTGLPDPGVSQ